MCFLSSVLKFKVKLSNVGKLHWLAAAERFALGWPLIQISVLELQVDSELISLHHTFGQSVVNV